jgi:hypothetical protein
LLKEDSVRPVDGGLGIAIAIICRCKLTGQEPVQLHEELEV